MILGGFLLTSSCKKSKTHPDIPNVNVNVLLQLSLPQYSSLNSIGNSIPIAGGYRGILVYRKSLDEFAAYEMACPYDPTNSNALIEVDSSGALGADQNCGSKFSLFDGSIVNGPSTLPLKQYRTDYDDGARTLHIFN